MSKSVIILGAGASAAAGAPVMATFLDRAEELKNAGRIKEAADVQAFNAVFKGLYALRSVFAKSSVDSDNLEAVFAAFGMALLLGRLGDLVEGEIEKLVPAFKRMIVRTLERTLLLRKTQGRFSSPQPYDQFASFIAKAGTGGRMSIITFNYDCALEPLKIPR